jgi:hypothetical protein
VYVVYALALNINFCILLLIPVALIINNSRINKFAKAFKKQYFFEILSKAKNRNNKNKSFNKLYLYFTDYELLKSVVEKYLKTLQSSEINESIGVIINKEHGICIPQDVLNRGTMVFGVTGGVKLTR